MRKHGRESDQLRPIRVTANYQRGPAASVLIQWGETWVICAASIDAAVPPFRSHLEHGGWITAEYNMLPSSTSPRKSRHSGGREKEIQRLIGRGLRSAFEIDAMGPYTITIDCDVVQADGGTRVASLTGGYVASVMALRSVGAEDCVKQGVAAVSVGIVRDSLLLDLDYEEDSQADVDLNLVMTSDGNLVEIQGTAERHPFSRSQLDQLCNLGWKGVRTLCAFEERILGQVDDKPITIEL
jgi:ribonuclease PH